MNEKRNTNLINDYIEQQDFSFLKGSVRGFNQIKAGEGNLLAFSSILFKQDQFALEQVVDEYIVEIIRLWDSDEQKWVTDSPVLVRLENLDVVLYLNESGCISYFFGAMNTEETIVFSPSNSSKQNDFATMPTFCWLRDEKCSCFSGEQINGVFNSDTGALSLVSFSVSDAWELYFCSNRNKQDRVLYVGANFYPVKGNGDCFREDV